MADLSRKTASVYINHQAAEDALLALQKQADTFTQKIKAGTEAGKTMVSEIAKLNKVQDDIAKVQKQIDSGLRPSFSQVSTQVSKLRNELKKMSEDAPGYADKFKAYQKASLELQRLGDQVNKVNAEQSKLGEFFNGFGGAFALGGIAAAGAALVGFFTDAVGEAAEAEEASARLKATLDNLGKGDAFDRITAQSDNLAKSLGYLDNDDINGVFEKLITYGKLTEGQMSKLAPVILDFSAKTRTSLPEATDTILKALEGNGKALKTFGINIKDAGNEEERFKIVTEDLGSKVAGAAEAFKGTFAGSVATTKQTVADLKEEIGTGLLPALKFVLGVVNDTIKGFEDFGDRIGTLIDGIKNFRTYGEQAQLDAAKSDADFRKKVSDGLALDFAQKPLEEQRRLFQGAIDNMHYFEGKYKEALKNQANLSDEQRLTLDNNIQQQRDNFTALQTTFINSMQEKGKADAEALEKQRQDDADKAEKLAEERKKKADAASAAAAVKAKQARERLEKELAALQKTIQDETDKLLLTGQELSIKSIEEENQKLLEKLKEGYKANLLTQEQYNEASLEVERIRVRKIAQVILPTKNAVVATPATGATIGSLGGPAAGAVASAQDNGPSTTAKIFNVAQVQEDAQQVLTTAQGVFDIVSAFNAAADARDQARIDKRVAQGEAEKASAKKLLDGKYIDQQEYDRRTRAADEKTRKDTAKLKKAQFDRDKKAQIVSATIMGAQAILSALTLQPFYIGLIMAAIATVKTVAEINKIKQTKAPEFARGGVLDGPGHSQGGMPVVDPRSGRKVAELEGGEPILSRRTYANNRSIVDRLLHASMYQNGASVSPAWSSSPAFGINYGALNRSVNNVKRYERGGLFGNDGSTGNGGIESAALLDTLNNVNRSLQTPQKAYVVISEINTANETLTDIKNDTVMSRK